MCRFDRWMVWLVFAGLILSACTGGAASPAPAGDPTGIPGMPEGTAPAALIPAGVEAARRELAQQVGLQPEEIEVQMYSPITWTNSCLNLEQVGQACAQVQTPGYNGMFIAGDALWEFRADESGRTVRLTPGAVLAARQVLGQQRGVPTESITLVSYEAVDWPTGCLGVELEGLECTQAVTPGFRVLLDIQGEEFEYHTDAGGGTVLLASAPEAEVDAVIVWQATEGEVCETAQIGLEAVAFGTCSGPQQTGRLVSEERVQQLQAFVSEFATFEADTPAGKVTFQGQGTQQPAPAEQRMIAEWAHLAFVEAAGGRSGASYGLAFSWHREGGIAGFCNDLTVYVTGEAYATSCEGGQPQDIGSRRLTADELEQVFGWIDSLNGFEFEQTDPATADAMTIRLVFSGAGEQEATEADQQAILDYAARLYTEMQQGPLSAAPSALTGYF